MNENDIEDANKYSYSISVVTNTGGAQEDVKIQLQKANTAFIQLYQVQTTREISTGTKLRIFRSKVKFVLYGFETW